MRANGVFSEEPEEISAQYAHGLAVTGEHKSFFAEGRVRYLRTWWDRHRRAEPKRVLDFGCGLGDVCPVLAAAFPLAEIVGIDPSERSIRGASRLHGADRVRFAVLTPELARSGFCADLVHLNGVIHHVPPDQRQEVFLQLALLLDPRGVLALFENNPINPGTRLVMSRIPFDHNAIPISARRTRSHLRRAGLVPLHTGYLFFFPRWLRLLRSLEPRLCRLPLGAQYGVFAAATGLALDPPVKGCS